MIHVLVLLVPLVPVIIALAGSVVVGFITAGVIRRWIRGRR